MLHEKGYYQELNYSGFQWAGYWDNLHHFTKKEDAGFLEMSCTEEMLNNGDAHYMAQHGLTFNPKSNLLK